MHIGYKEGDMASTFWGSVLLGSMGTYRQQKCSGHMLSSCYQPAQSNRDPCLTEFSGNFLRVTCENQVSPWQLNLSYVNPTWNIHVCPPSAEWVLSCHSGIVWLSRWPWTLAAGFGPFSAFLSAFYSSSCLNKSTFLLEVVQICQSEPKESPLMQPWRRIWETPTRESLTKGYRQHLHTGFHRRLSSPQIKSSVNSRNGTSASG